MLTAATQPSQRRRNKFILMDPNINNNNLDLKTWKNSIH